MSARIFRAEEPKLVVEELDNACLLLMLVAADLF